MTAFVLLAACAAGMSWPEALVSISAILAGATVVVVLVWLALKS